jgi:hypothetical protein
MFIHGTAGTEVDVGRKRGAPGEIRVASIIAGQSDHVGKGGKSG